VAWPRPAHAGKEERRDELEYDVIGDVHGHAAALEALLEELGYAERGGAYRHADPSRMVLFLGDLVDRGPEQVRSIDIPRRMRDAGTALVLMGNHEHNAIGYATPDPERPGHHLRIRGSKNRAQHQAFLDQVGEGSGLHMELVEWMKTLPMWFETDGFRAVHACWHPDRIALLEGHAGPDGAIREDALYESFRKGSALRDAAEIVLKGLEIDLPDGMFFHDANGHRREKSRVRWWDRDATTFASAAIAEEGMEGLPDVALPAAARLDGMTDDLTFFGHYWMQGDPHLLTPFRTCLDFSIAKGGSLCAYSWRGEPVLDPRNLTWVGQPAPAAVP